MKDARTSARAWRAEYRPPAAGQRADGVHERALAFVIDRHARLPS
jgi:hypothetical protein